MPRFSPAFLDELRARLRASDVIGRTVKLRKEGREYRGLSPFTSEKTPSFFVNDEKARYFDFSSGRSGDIVGFLVDTQNLTFVEAVTQLAEWAGMELPKDSEDDRRRAAAQKGIAEANAAAASFFAAQLARAPGREALVYLDRREVTPAAREAFGLGYAPGGRAALRDHLVEKGFRLDLLAEAGLVIRPDDGGAPYDKFRDRVMFPILGTGGKVIAFGGRALSKDTPAKYMNSPETPLFHKSATLYNFTAARARLKDPETPLLVAEGYMDVIALAQSGYAAVAPLGTALTERQLQMLWQASDEPLLCFDGDRAGQSAAFRAIDRALPLLTPGKSLRFVFLPDGQDPDDVLKAEGPEAMEALLAAARPLFAVLWEHERDAADLSTPERRAGFRRRLRDRVAGIADRDVRRAYGEEMARQLSTLFAPGVPATAAGAITPAGRSGPSQLLAGARRGHLGRSLPPTPSPALRQTLGRRAEAAARDACEAVLVLGACHHPQLAVRHEDALLSLSIEQQGLARLLQRFVGLIVEDPDLDRDAVASHIEADKELAEIYRNWSSDPRVRPLRFLRPDAPDELAEQGWLSTLSKVRSQGDLEAEVADAARVAHQDLGREQTWRDVISHRARLLSEHKPDGGSSS